MPKRDPQKGGFTDVEMGPLIGSPTTQTHERKKRVGDDSSESEPLIVGKTSLADIGKEEPPAGSSKYAKQSTGGSGGKALMSCAMYCFCSVSMVLVNKSLASSYNHLIARDLNVLLVVLQAVVAVIAVEFCKKMKWVDYPSFNMYTARQWAPVNVLFCAMLFTGMASLQYNNVPMVTVFKNITNILVAAGDKYFFGTSVEYLVMVAFGLMLLGAVAAARNDIHVTTAGLFWMCANCVSTAGYILYMKFATKNVQLSKFGMVFYNNLLCIVFLFPVAFFDGEFNLFMVTGAIRTSDYFFKNFFAGFVGFFLNFASLNCVQQTGPSTYAIVGSLNKIPIAILGWFLFKSEITPQTWFFIGVSMAGGFLYSYAKIKASKKKMVS
eukprot:CAMPEP_0172488504 /NCGR_PEP_ID=MMETSP1066-20121228/18044_1 /TAXON_ID=671091 /ORGANISM="Coscinodiscus wailesii, Strain CCMP2513" /LENGTH=380 /DNA_ID=CAMNT_0013255755 /DNA_START=163 /DNA_END=1305 /DNA_ORIENTATION=+